MRVGPLRPAYHIVDTKLAEQCLVDKSKTLPLPG